MTLGQIFEFLFRCRRTFGPRFVCLFFLLNPIKQVYFCSISQKGFERKRAIMFTTSQTIKGVAASVHTEPHTSEMFTHTHQTHTHTHGVERVFCLWIFMFVILNSYFG